MVCGTIRHLYNTEPFCCLLGFCSRKRQFFCVHCSDDFLGRSFFYDGEDGQLYLLQALMQVISHFAMIKELLLWQSPICKTCTITITLTVSISIKH